MNEKEINSMEMDVYAKQYEVKIIRWFSFHLLFSVEKLRISIK